MSKYISFPAYYDDAPIDLSFVYDDKPAGKHGFIQAKGDNFKFEDGTTAKFWGTNFNGGTCFTEFGMSEKVAKRLSKIGVNIVRFHQLDAEWDVPNIFQYSKGKRLDNTMQFDPESLKRLDYLVYCLKKEGIYCYLDLLTYRKFKSGDGVENAIELGDAAKPYCIYNRRLIELQKQYAYDLWTHINPYTGLAYKDDPVFVMCEVVNECDLFTNEIKAEPYKTEFKEMFVKWCEERNIKIEDFDLMDSNEDLAEFKIQTMANYYDELFAFMRSIGVKIPLTGTNWTTRLLIAKANKNCDFSDNHGYFYDWSWGEYKKRCVSKALTQANDVGTGGLALNRKFGKPHFVSEWDMPWPNEYRAESPILYAAIGELQNWSGFAIHTYAYCARLDLMNILGKEVSSNTIGGIAYREGIFSTWNDPAKFGLFYHAALITRRGDISPAENEITIAIDSNGNTVPKAFLGATEYSKIGVTFDKENDAMNMDTPIGEFSKEVRSDNLQLYRNLLKNYGTIDSPMTKCVYGFLGKNPTIELENLRVKCDTDYAVIALSSLSNKPIENSDNILLTTVGRARNTEMKYDGETLTDYGKAPILVEVIETAIAIKTDVENLRVWSVNAEGIFAGVIPSIYENGELKFDLGKTFSSMYYLIQAE